MTGDDAEELLPMVTQVLVEALLPMVTQVLVEACCSWYAARKSSGS